MAHDESHGHSVAAWTGVTTLMVAAVVMSAAVVWPSRGLFIAGVVLAVVGVVAGKVLAMAGFGARKSTEGSPEREPGQSQVDSGIG
jgi:hypothetical protein